MWSFLNRNKRRILKTFLVFFNFKYFRFFYDHDLSKLTSYRSIKKEEFVVKIAREALAKDDEPWLALEVLGKTSQWRLAAEHVLKMNDFEHEQDNFADYENESRPNDSSKMNDKFFELNNRHHIQSLKMSAICTLMLRASEEKDFEMVWNLMDCQCLGENLNVMKNNIPDELLELFDKVKCEVTLLFTQSHD